MRNGSNNNGKNGKLNEKQSNENWDVALDEYLRHQMESSDSQRRQFCMLCRTEVNKCNLMATEVVRSTYLTRAH